jgi:hypothetical protein
LFFFGAASASYFAHEHMFYGSMWMLALPAGWLLDRLTRLSERAGTRVRGVYEWKLSEKSKKANAALMGMGRTRRIILADTLLFRGPTSTPEDRRVAAAARAT